MGGVGGGWGGWAGFSGGSGGGAVAGGWLLVSDVLEGPHLFLHPLWLQFSQEAALKWLPMRVQTKAAKHTYTHTCLHPPVFSVCVCDSCKKKRKKEEKLQKIRQKSLLQVVVEFFTFFILFLSCNVQMEKELQICTADVLRNTCAIMQLIFLRFFASFPTLLHCLPASALLLGFLLLIFSLFFRFAGQRQRSFNLAATNLPLPWQVRLIKQIACCC